MASETTKKLIFLAVAWVLVGQVQAKDVVQTLLAYPTGDPASSGLLVNKTAPAEVMLNQKYDYCLEAYNKTDSPLFDVVIQELLPEGFDIQNTSPEAKIKDYAVIWNLEVLSPGAKKQFTISGVPSSVGDLISCTSATYSLHACVLTKVLQPALKLTVKSSDVVLECDPVIVNYDVINEGTGTTRNVVVNHKLPTGLTTLDGSSSVVLNIESLAPGKRASSRKLLKAGRTGNFSSTALATAEGGLKSSANTNTKVVVPVLTVDVSGPQKILLSRKATYLINVANRGDGIADNLNLIMNVPASVRVDKISNNGRQAGNRIIWDKLGALKPNQSINTSVTLEPRQKGTVDVSALAKATCAAEVKDLAKTLVEGIPAILLEVIDLSDPVAVGEYVTYVIKVTNQGTADGTNIRILATLENAMQYVSSQGASKAQVSGTTVRFNPLARLAPKQVASWQIKVRAASTGDVRFKIKLESDQIRRSVDETEATNFYE